DTFASVFKADVLVVPALKDDVLPVRAELRREQLFATAEDAPFIAAVHVDQVEALLTTAACKGNRRSVRADGRVKADCQQTQVAGGEIVEVDVAAIRGLDHQFA